MNGRRVWRLMQTLLNKHNLSVKKISNLIVGRGSFNASVSNARKRKKARIYKEIKYILDHGQGSHVQKVKAVLKIDLV